MRLTTVVIALALSGTVLVRAQAGSDGLPWQAFIATASTDQKQAQAALASIGSVWRDGYAAMIIDVARFFPSSRTADTREENLPWI